MSGTRGTAAVITVGSELTTGLRLDTNTREIAAALALRGYLVTETVSIADDVERLSLAIERLCSACDLVVVTGGLGPTHDDITRQAAARALGTSLAEDPTIREQLERIAARHTDPEAAHQVFAQALVLPGARVIAPSTGTAPGQVVETDGCTLAMLPGPPLEMRPMLAEVLGAADGPAARVVRCAGISESDAQVKASRVLAAHPGVELTVLASPWLVDVVLAPAGADDADLERAEAEIADALRDWCFAREPSKTLAAATLDAALECSLTIATAESCTGGMVAAALSDIAGASSVLLGGVVAYSNDAKTALLGVGKDTLARFGAVSQQTAEEMAAGAVRAFGADVGVATTGIAGPGGGSADKPVGLVWFAIADATGTTSWSLHLFGDRQGVRTRATLAALDAVRRHILDG